MIRRSDAIGQCANNTRVRFVGLHADRDSTKGFGHGAAIDHHQNGQVVTARKIGRRGLAIEKPHHAFNQNDIVVAGGARQTPGHIGFAAHAEIQVFTGGLAGDGMDLRVEEIRATFEDLDASPLAAMQTRQGGGDHGFALP